MLRTFTRPFPRGRALACAVTVALVPSVATAQQAPAASPAAEVRYDLVITGGRIVDGTGRPARAGDVAVRGGWIVRVAAPGALRSAAATTRIDATGLVVSPGFVDVHSHSIEEAFKSDKRLNEGVVRQGVTTIVGGPDGYFAPFHMRMLLDSLKHHGSGTNVAMYIGHNGVREAVMGMVQRAPTAEELAKMKAMVREGMELGAVGLSSGLMYEPGMFSKTDELVELAKEVAPYRGIYDSHVRDPGHHLIESDRETIEIGERAGISPKIAHEKVVGLENASLLKDVVALVEGARARGVNAVTDQYPYDGAATAHLEELIVVPEVTAKAPGFDLKALLRDKMQRPALKESSEHGINGGFAWLKATGYSQMRITSSPENPSLVGQYLSELATARRVDPFDLVADLILGATKPIGITLGAVREVDVRNLLVKPWNMVASDGAYVDPAEGTRGHPRSAGTFPRVLGRYVREQHALTLEEAVRKMTSFPADFVGLHDRGRVAEGQAADLAIWNPRTIADQSTWEQPSKMATGMIHVFVGGVAVLKDGAMTGVAPGRFLAARH
ncbi:MAG: amidohydrolase family protein [Gemmatimonadaceae bacterium]